ncbi:MAG: hypothetical protein HY867_11540 [Chloroflexi bacterium]|nr:hypothetical protein [Chloroflexota bacterium]
MEKRSPFYYFGLFVLVVFTIISFSMGNLMVIDFVADPKVNHYIYGWLPFLGTFTFIAGYFVRLFSAQNPKRHRLIFVCGIFLPLIALFIAGIQTPDHFLIRLLLIAGVNYFYAGALFAWSSDRLRTVLKI